MITELYNALTEAIRSIGIGQDPRFPEEGIIKHIDLWNQNVVFIDQDDPWYRPAVFIEFGEIVWEPYKGPAIGLTGKGEILLHIVTDWKGSAAAGRCTREETLADYDLSMQIHSALRGLRGTGFRNLCLSRTMINHNHQELLENIEVYRVTYERREAEQ